MKKKLSLFLGAIVGFIVFVAKADIASASTLMFYQPKLPEKTEDFQ